MRSTWGPLRRRQRLRCIVDLPTEILEAIAESLVPPPEHWKFWSERTSKFPTCPWDYRATPFRANCKSLRLTCKAFAALRTPIAALFHDVTIHSDKASMERLTSISDHATIRHVVRRLVFVGPVLVPGLVDDELYREHMHQEARKRFEERLEGADLSYREQEMAINALIEGSFPWSEDELTAGVAEYREYFKEQERVLESYPSFISGCLAQLPKVKRLVISGTIPEEGLTRDDVPGSANYNRRMPFEHYYPGTHLTWVRRNANEWDGGLDSYISSILEGFARAQVRLEEIVTFDDAPPSRGFQWHPLGGGPHNLDFSSLRLLDLWISYWSTSHNLNFDLSLGPLLERLTALEQLYLFCPMLVADGRATLSRLFELQFPKLKEMGLVGIEFDAPAFANFLSRHPGLQEIALDDVLPTGEAWWTLFASIRAHQGLQRFHLTNLEGDNELLVDYLGTDPFASLDPHNLHENTQMLKDLRRYLKGEGTWGQSLRRVWGNL